VVNHQDTREERMIDIVKKSALSSLILLAVCMLISIFAAGNVMSSENAEETADTVLPYDDVITGKMDDFSERLIYVDGFGYRFCDNVKIFNPRNRLIQLENIEAAVEVKVFVNKGCIRKIKVLQYAQ
jgi:hypothetical protein